MERAMSVRERLSMKRRAKALGKADSLALPSAASLLPQLSAIANGGGGGGSGDGALPSPRSFAAAQAAQEAAEAEADAAEWRAVEAGAWPFRRLATELLLRLTDACWEVRHGAAAALCELLRSHAACAAVAAPVDADAPGGWAAPGGAGKRRLLAPPPGAAAAAAAARAAWLRDAAALLLAVLVLDRFADYVSDSVRGKGGVFEV